MIDNDYDENDDGQYVDEEDWYNDDFWEGAPSRIYQTTGPMDPEFLRAWRKRMRSIYKPEVMRKLGRDMNNRPLKPQPISDQTLSDPNVVNPSVNNKPPSKWGSYHDGFRMREYPEDKKDWTAYQWGKHLGVTNLPPSEYLFDRGDDPVSNSQAPNTQGLHLQGGSLEGDGRWNMKSMIPETQYGYTQIAENGQPMIPQEAGTPNPEPKLKWAYPLRSITDEEHWNFVNGRYAKQTRIIESNDTKDLYLKNPKSTAKGPYQMTDGFRDDGDGFWEKNKLFSPKIIIPKNERNDPVERDNQNKAAHAKTIKSAIELGKTLNRTPLDWEVYISHFTGANGFKEKFYKYYEENPDATITEAEKADKDKEQNSKDANKTGIAIPEKGKGLLTVLNNHPAVKAAIEAKGPLTYKAFADYYIDLFGKGTTWDVLHTPKPKEARIKDDKIP